MKVSAKLSNFTGVLGIKQYMDMTTVVKAVAYLWTSMVRNCPCFLVKNLGGATCASN
jgi:hypothetical protein